MIRPQGRGGNSGSTFGIGKWGMAIMKEGKTGSFCNVKMNGNENLK